MTVASREAWSKRGSADRDQGQHFKILTKTGGGGALPPKTLQLTMNSLAWKELWLQGMHQR